MAVGPDVLGGAHLGQRGVGDLEQTALLEVGGGDPPASTKVDVEVVAQHVAQHLLGVGAGVELQLGVDGEVVEGQGQGGEDGVGDLVVLESVGAGLGRGLVERRPQQADLHKVVEVSGLERGVLAVVGEAQQLAGLGRQRGVGPQAAHGREAEHGGGGAAAFGAKRGQLGEVGLALATVGHPAEQAEAERGRDPPGQDAALVELAATAHRHGFGEVFGVAALDPRAVCRLLQPVLREAIDDLVRVVGPRIGGAEVEEARRRRGLGLMVAEPARDHTAHPGAIEDPSGGVVLLSAVTTERQRQQHDVAMPGDEALPVEGEVASLLGLQRGEDGVAFADELVKAEGKGGETGLGVAGVVAGHELRPDDLGGGLDVDARELGQLGRSAVETGHRSGRYSYQPSVELLDAEGLLDPARQRVIHEVGVVDRSSVVASAQAPVKSGQVHRITEIEVGGGPT